MDYEQFAKKLKRNSEIFNLSNPFVNNLTQHSRRQGYEKTYHKMWNFFAFLILSTLCGLQIVKYMFYFRFNFRHFSSL